MRSRIVLRATRGASPLCAATAGIRHPPYEMRIIGTWSASAIANVQGRDDGTL